MKQLEQKREKFTVSIRKEKNNISMKQKRHTFISEYDPEFAYDQQWSSLILKLKSSDQIIPIMNSIRALSNHQRIIQSTHFQQTLNILLKYISKQYDFTTQQILVSQILSNLTYSKHTISLLLKKTQIKEQIVRRLKVNGHQHVQVKQNYFWIINNILDQHKYLINYFLQNHIVTDIVVYFKQVGTQSKKNTTPEERFQQQKLKNNQILQGMRTIILITCNKESLSYLHFQILIKWIFQFASLNHKDIICYCTIIISLFTQMQYGEIALIDIQQNRFMKKIAQFINTITSIQNQNSIILIESFLNIVMEYNRNEANLKQLLQIGIVKSFRTIISLEGLNTQTFYTLFMTIQQMIKHQKVIEQITKDELLEKIIEFYLHSQLAVHMSSLKITVLCILSLTSNNSNLSLPSVAKRLSQDLVQLHKLNNNQQVDNLVMLVDIAIEHIEKLYEMN